MKRIILSLILGFMLIGVMGIVVAEDNDTINNDTAVCDSDNILHQNIKKEKCCDSVFELFSGNQVEQQALLTLEIEKAQFILAFAYTYINLSSEYSEAIIFNFHPPPLVDKDITVLYQTFLI